MVDLAGQPIRGPVPIDLCFQNTYASKTLAHDPAPRLLDIAAGTFKILKMTLLKSIADCQQLQAEIGPQVGKECKDSYDEKNICNGTKIDCVKKGKEKCMSDRKCYGIMYNWWWAKKEKGVKICTSWTYLQHIINQSRH